MLQRIRYAVEHEAFKRPLDGTIGIDGKGDGGKGPGKPSRGGASGAAVVDVVERGDEVRCGAAALTSSV